MKQICLLAICCTLLFSCKSKPETDQVKTDTARLVFPFKARYSINWQPGDEKNAVIVLTV